jgi:signal transduction histidine kinase
MRAAVTLVATGGDPKVAPAASALLQEVARLPLLRTQVSSKSVTTATAAQAYTAMTSAGYQAIAASFLEMPDVHLVSQSSAVLRIAEAEDDLLQAQALVASDAAVGSFPAADRARFATLTGEYQGLLAEALPDLDSRYRTPFQQAAASPQAMTLNALNAQVITAPPGKFGVNVATYGQVAQTVALGIALAGFSAGQNLAAALHAAAGPIDTRVFVTGGAGLAAIIASIGLSVWIGQGIIRELAVLRREALDLARRRLPQVMTRLSSGEDVDVAAEAPPLLAGADEIGQVRQAFNTVQRAAIEAAAEQAKLRSGIATVFRNLAMRSQSLVYQQLRLLDNLEHQASGPEELDRLFKIDHLATRMRRNAEGLLILAGDQPARTWTEPVPIVDVLRGSVAEVVDYARIRVACSSRAALHGYAVADVIHLVAELAENATAYSPPKSPVRVTGSDVLRGFAIEVEDRGVGIPPEVAAQLNAALADPPPFNPAESDHLGLYVAARLAQRHGVSIVLRHSPYGGTTAIVFIPDELIASDRRHRRRDQAAMAAPEASLAANGSADPGTGRPAALSGRHASRDTPRYAGVNPAGAEVTPHGPRSDKARDRPAPARHPSNQAGSPEAEGFQLPRRVRGANMPLQSGRLRASPSAGRPGVPPRNGISAEDLRTAFADIQGGMDRGNRESLAPAAFERGLNGPGSRRGADPATWPLQASDPHASERRTGENDRQY